MLISAAEKLFALDFLQEIFHCQIALLLQVVELVLMMQFSMVFCRSQRFSALGTVTYQQFVTTGKYALFSKLFFPQPICSS